MTDEESPVDLLDEEVLIDDEWMEEGELSGSPSGGVERPWVQPVHLANFTWLELVVGFFTAFAAACRTGIPTRILEGQVAMPSDADGLADLAIDVPKTRREHLEKNLQTYVEQERKAHEAVIAAPEGWQRDGYLKDEAAAHAKVEGARQKLKSLPEDEPVVQPRKILTLGDLFTQTFQTILESGHHLDQEQFRALRVLVTDYEIVLGDDGLWRASGYVRLPMPKKRLAIFGPVEHVVGRGGRSAGTLRALVATSSTELSPDDLTDCLSKYQELSDEAILLLRNTPLTALPYTVMHGLDGRPVPAWVSDDWTDRPHEDWVTKYYQRKDLTKVGKAAFPSPERQLLAHLAAATGGFVEEELIELIGVPFVRFIAYTAGSYTNEKAGWQWRSPVIRTNSKPVRYMPVIGECGHMASLVTHVPHVERDLLCPTCGRMPQASSFRVPKDVVFPMGQNGYDAVLGLSLDQCLADIRHRAQSSPWHPNDTHLRVLAELSKASGGLKGSEVARGVGIGASGADAALQALWSLRRISRLQRKPSAATVWSFVESATNMTNLRRTVERLEQIGPAVGKGELANRSKISWEALMKQHVRDHLLAVGKKNGLYYPEWQFNEDGSTRDVVRPLLLALREADPWAAAVWATTKHANLNGKSPIQALETGTSPTAVANLAARARSQLKI